MMKYVLFATLAVTLFCGTSPVMAGEQARVPVQSASKAAGKTRKPVMVPPDLYVGKKDWDWTRLFSWPAGR